VTAVATVTAEDNGLMTPERVARLLAAAPALYLALDRLVADPAGEQARQQAREALDRV
jgi:hypothetical protein